jgi:hypothetical protein
MCIAACFLAAWCQAGVMVDTNLQISNATYKVPGRSTARLWGRCLHEQDIDVDFLF